MGDMADEAIDQALDELIYGDEWRDEIEAEYNIETQTVTVHYPEWVVDEQKNR